MYDADYENYLEDLKEEVENAGYYVTRDSGKRAEHSDGVVRDTEEGKTKYTLMFPKGVPMKDQLIVRIAELYTRGGNTYGDRNWEDSSSEDTLAHHTDALWRHFMNFFFGVQDGEDHAAAVAWNVNAVDLTRRNIAKKKAEAVEEADEPQIDTAGTDIFKSYIFPYIGENTASTGKYYQKEIRADSYSEAKMLFDNWLAKQPYYNLAPESPLPSAVADSELKWSEGDVLEEVTEALDGSPYCWVYSRTTDTWKYKIAEDAHPNPDSARSLKKLTAEFGPLKCTKGSHTGRIVGGS